MAPPVDFIDPTAGGNTLTIPLAMRPADLTGLVVGLLDNSKEQGDVILRRESGRPGRRGPDAGRVPEGVGTVGSHRADLRPARVPVPRGAERVQEADAHRTPGRSEARPDRIVIRPVRRSGRARRRSADAAEPLLTTTRRSHPAGPVRLRLTGGCTDHGHPSVDRPRPRDAGPSRAPSRRPRCLNCGRCSR